MCSSKKTCLMGSGVTMIIFSLLMFIWQIANDVQLSVISLILLSACGYWAGLLFLVVGILATIGGKNESRGVIIGAFVMSIISLIIAGIGSLVVYGRNAAAVGIVDSQNSDVDLGALYALWIPLLIFALVLVVLDIVVLAVTSAYICCSSKSDQAV